jgi:hypothetical protein
LRWLSQFFFSSSISQAKICDIAQVPLDKPSECVLDGIKDMISSQWQQIACAIIAKGVALVKNPCGKVERR